MINDDGNLALSDRATVTPFRIEQHFARYWAAALAALVLVTYRLWLPVQWTHTGYYPAIPLVPVSDWLSVGVPMVLGPLIGIATFVIVVRPQNMYCQRSAWLGIALCLALGFLTDQHRLQPWAYQTFLYAWIFVLLPKELQLIAFRILAISIYFYSAIGKFDFQFLHTVGQEFLTTVTRFIHLEIVQWSDRSRLLLAAGFPTVELLIAVLLLFPRSRILGGWLAFAMHVGLIVILSPWGMHHSSGVLVWNGVLAGQAYWLFIRKPIVQTVADQPEAWFSLRTILAGVLILLAVTLPLTERRDRYDADAWHWDHWTSWALYSPHNSRVDVEIYAGAVESLPPEIQAAVVDDLDGDSWSKLDLSKLSLYARGVPVLPQARYQLQLATAIAREQGWTHEIRGVFRSASDRRDGSRREVWMNRFGPP